jgi:predicted small secreted protein
MQILKSIVILFVSFLLIQISHAKGNGSNISETGSKVADAAKILFNGLPVLVNEDEQQARSQVVIKNIKQSLKNGEITEKESRRQLRENCMRFLNKPEDKAEFFLSASPIVDLLKGLDVLCPQYR